MPKRSTMRDDIREFLIGPKQIGKQFTTVEIHKRFGTSINNIWTHLKALRDCPNKYVLQPRRGLWEGNPEWQSDEALRKKAEDVGKTRVFQSNGFQHGKDTLQPAIIATKYWKRHLESIVIRMELMPTVFTPVDIEAMRELMQQKWAKYNGTIEVPPRT